MSRTSTEKLNQANGKVNQGVHPSLFNRAIYRILHPGFWLLLKILYRVRHDGVENVPRKGAVLLACNHQSLLDPPVVGTGIWKRPLHFIARAGLFETAWFGWIITAVNSIPIKEEGSDTAAIRQVLERLKAGHAVLIFPEGTRSHDGTVGEFRRGVALMVRKAECPVIPVAVEGCHDAWPRGRSRPYMWGQRLAVRYGKPMPPEVIKELGGAKALEVLREEVDQMRLELRAELRQRTHGSFPAAGAGDVRSTPKASPQQAEAE